MTARKIGYVGDEAMAFCLRPNYHLVGLVLEEMTSSMWDGEDMPQLNVSKNLLMFQCTSIVLEKYSLSVV